MYNRGDYYVFQRRPADCQRDSIGPRSGMSNRRQGVSIKTAIYDSYASRQLSLANLIKIYSSEGVSRVIYKKLSPNDNSKNQPYMGSHLTDLGFHRKAIP